MQMWTWQTPCRLLPRVDLRTIARTTHETVRASHTVARACAQVYRPSPSASTEASAAEVVSAIAARLSDNMPTGVLPFERTAAHPAAVVETAFKNYCERLLM